MRNDWGSGGNYEVGLPINTTIRTGELGSRKLGIERLVYQLLSREFRMAVTDRGAICGRYGIKPIEAGRKKGRRLCL